MSRLHEMKCEACRGGDPPLTEEQIEALRAETPRWTVIEVEGVKRLERMYRFDDFASAISFTDVVAALAEANAHHPRIVTEWGTVTVQWWTHKIRGLHQNDFIMAAKTEQAYDNK